MGIIYHINPNDPTSIERAIAKLAQANVKVNESEVLILDSEMSQVESRILILESEMSEIESEVLTLDSEMSQVESRILILESEMSEIESEVLTLDSEMSQVQSDLDQAILYISSANSVVQEASSVKMKNHTVKIDGVEYVFTQVISNIA